MAEVKLHRKVRLWMRRLGIVAIAIVWIAIAYAVLRDVITNGPTAGYSSGRIPHSSSSVGTLAFVLIAAPIAVYWVFRTWNRSGSEMRPPQSYFTRRRGKRRE